MRVQVVRICSLGNISSNVKGTHEYYGSKEPQWKVLKVGTQKSRFWKFFPIMTLLWGHIHSFEKWGSNVEKMAKTKSFSRNLFWSESIQIGPQLILEWKSWFRKIFPLWLFFGGIAIISKNGVHRSKKWQMQKFLLEIFLIGIDSEWS